MESATSHLSFYFLKLELRALQHPAYMHGPEFRNHSDAHQLLDETNSQAPLKLAFPYLFSPTSLDTCRFCLPQGKIH